ncbi:hypothetical protein [Streptomyces anulatus]|uniref:hypothetical protein n=1 Tax=Streptomyces anulatus TaxID=1892 RepID=UPI002E13564D|nr:hypothetical protein OG557_39175 [Streptomyces anulatus]
MTETPGTTHTVTARLPGGRYLVAILDPNTEAEHSPLRRHLRTEATQATERQQGPETRNPN